MAEGKTATLHRMVLDDHICPYGVKSLALLQEHGYAVDDRLLTTREEVDAFEEQWGVDTTPQIVIDGERIGGCDDLIAFLGEEREGAG